MRQQESAVTAIEGHALQMETEAVCQLMATRERERERDAVVVLLSLFSHPHTHHDQSEERTHYDFSDYL